MLRAVGMRYGQRAMVAACGTGNVRQRAEVDGSGKVVSRIGETTAVASCAAGAIVALSVVTIGLAGRSIFEIRYQEGFIAGWQHARDSQARAQAQEETDRPHEA